MKVAIGFLGGQFGDLFIEEPTIRAFLAQNPDYNLILACNKKYFNALSFYRNYSPRIIGFYPYEGYDNMWPTAQDQTFIRSAGVDFIFNAMAQHKDPHWPLYRHQTIECGNMFDIAVEDPQIHLPLPPGVPHRKRTVALSLFPNNAQGVKVLSVEKVSSIVAHCKSLGYDVLQLNGPSEPTLENAYQTNTDFYHSGLAMLGCTMLVSCDSAMAWLASAFEFPMVGLYSIDYYPFCSMSKNWNPVNKNARYLEARRAEDIPNEHIFEKIDELAQLQRATRAA